MPAARSLPIAPAFRSADAAWPIARWAQLWSSRRALARLDPHLLRDIGLDLGEAEVEAARPFWKA
ncbi:DUF1127 domain-containing protein [Wenxinia marina]|uniref:DUF1127 domain-containing protein n=1 Tax=Wenxinia marina TaxID=390641 RepID=UPI00035EDDA0|nr:DUF1127 domain-containing protein [Wenxinia marina]GGL74720.1 hypothetical protein GCM10011392_31700 [Wenxinia marina]